MHSNWHSNWHTNWRRQALAGAVIVGLAWPQAVTAEGALAIGLPADVAKEGVAFGWAVGYPTRQRAEAEALEKCRNFQGAPPSTRGLCKLFKSFDGQCFAIALDPQDGTPGVGWAIAANQKAAENNAMDACLATAGANRRNFCQVSATRCDERARQN
jgi:hypothetical protein